MNSLFLRLRDNQAMIDLSAEEGLSCNILFQIYKMINYKY